MGFRSSDRERIAQYDDVLPKKETYSRSGRECGKKGGKGGVGLFFFGARTLCVHMME